MCMKTTGAIPMARCRHSRCEIQRMGKDGRLHGLESTRFCTVDKCGKMCDGRDQRCHQYEAGP